MAGFSIILFVLLMEKYVKFISIGHIVKKNQNTSTVFIFFSTFETYLNVKKIFGGGFPMVMHWNKHCVGLQSVWQAPTLSTGVIANIENPITHTDKSRWGNTANVLNHIQTSLISVNFYTCVLISYCITYSV